jgi:alkylation response protein AidB-like acyl-CoA dehydrogenase
MNFEFTQEQVMLRDMARQFAEQEMMPTLKEFERKRQINTALVKKAGALGLRGVQIPPEFGGLGLDYTSCAIIWEQLSKASWTQTLAFAGDCILAGTIIMTVASKEQKDKYLPALSRGEKMIAVAAVEPNAGSDAGAVETSAVLDGEDWIINGTKNFITSGSLADVILVLVQTDKSKGPKGLAIIALDKNTPGFSSALVEMIGDRTGDVSNLRFADCRVPRGNLIGDIGRGLQNSLVGIDTARLFISSGAIGMAQSCLDACVKYAKERFQFGRPIGSFQLVQETIARMQAEIEVLRWQLYYVANLKTEKKPHAKEMSALKWLASELAVKVSTEAIKLHGAYGCTDDFPVEHHYRDAILSNILGGTAEMHKLTIGRELTGLNALS